jgi:hypothetical protein
MQDAVREGLLPVLVRLGAENMEHYGHIVMAGRRACFVQTEKRWMQLLAARDALVDSAYGEEDDE